MSNLITDLVVRFNAALKCRSEFFYVPHSNLNLRLLELFLKYNCINGFTIDTCRRTHHLRVKVIPSYVFNDSLIRKLELISKPSRRVYWTAESLSFHFARNNFQGFYVLSTPLGVCSSNELIVTRDVGHRISGEVLLKVSL